MIDCAALSGERFRPFFGQPIRPSQFEAWLAGTGGLSGLTRREEEGAIILDWRSGGLAYSAGFQEDDLIFVSLHFGPGQLSARQVIACLGNPQRYQAWYDDYSEISAGSLQAILIYPNQWLAVYGSIYLPIAPLQPPELDDSLPVGMINLYGPDWGESERSSLQSQPWLDDWKSLEIKVVDH